MAHPPGNTMEAKGDRKGGLDGRGRFSPSVGRVRRWKVNGGGWTGTCGSRRKRVRHRWTGGRKRGALRQFSRGKWRGHDSAPKSLRRERRSGSRTCKKGGEEREFHQGGADLEQEARRGAHRRRRRGSKVGACGRRLACLTFHI
jgi:hypothetical protein